MLTNRYLNFISSIEANFSFKLINLLTLENKEISRFLQEIIKFLSINPCILEIFRYNQIYYYFLITLGTFLFWSLTLYFIYKGFLGKNLKIKITTLNINTNKLSIIILIISLILFYLIYFILLSNSIFLDTMEHITQYNNIYIKGLNAIANKYGELICYAVGVKLSSIYLKILPADPIFYFYFGLGLGPSLTLTVHKEQVSSIGLSNNSTNSVLLNIQSADSHVDFLKDMVPRYYQYYHTTKMTNFENNTIILSGNAPTNINCPLENADLINSTYLNFFNLIEALNNDFLIILFLFLLVIFFILSFIFYKFF
uniref:Uncharacterized protein n=1 Tax=Heterobasidion irregulare TaxID=984962 RepID=A0A075DE60_9AGAM|nr:hypothetical protein [Heterobasidion irregulare]AHK09738.1 hypothetical protein [Heterobasidion irregulare]